MVGNIVKSGIAIYEIEKGKVCAKYVYTFRIFVVRWLTYFKIEFYLWKENFF